MKKYRDYYGRVVLVDVVKETEKTVTFRDSRLGFTARYHKKTVKLFDTFDECKAQIITDAKQHLEQCRQNLERAELKVLLAGKLTESDMK